MGGNCKEARGANSTDVTGESTASAKGQWQKQIWHVPNTAQRVGWVSGLRQERETVGEAEAERWGGVGHVTTL